MGKEINLLKNYPKAKRDLDNRAKEKSDEDRIIARRFDKDFFDGDRKHGYGGFNYNPRFWQTVVKDFQDYWNLDEKSSILDVGCAKGFMLFDFHQLIPGMKIEGIDISEYAIKNSKAEVSSFIQVGDASSLSYEDNSFDYVISINTIHNLDLAGCKKALKEIDRVSKKGSFITVDAFRDDEEKKRMYAWNLTAKTIMSTEDWKNLFNECDYNGDYYWFIP